MKTILLTIALATTSLFANEYKPVQILKDSPEPQRYLYGISRVPGTVKLRLQVDETGKLRRVNVISGRPELVGSALRMVHDYKFAPAQSIGRAVSGEMELELNFNFSGQ